jgi:Family of unknown function (DUF5947)
MTPARAIQSLRRFTQLAPGQQRCELCSAALGERHDHLLALDGGELRCACPGCALAFAAQGARFRRVLPRVRRLRDDLVADSLWAALGVPVGLAFFSRRSRTGQVVACFPGPAGPTHAYPPALAWAALCEAAPDLAAIMPDTEALLVRRLGGVREHWRVSIDVCQRLVAFMRAGTASVDTFFATLEETAS